MREMKTKALVKLLESKGYREDRQKGSHLTLKDSVGKTVTIVNTRIQSPGTLRNVAKLAGLDLR
jgi:predicted RNA binding protein YcfA (HicA-like mRNA interferase family)